MSRSPRRLNRLLAAARIVAIDVGARGGFSDDLDPIGLAVEAIGFEPDEAECDRLNEDAAKNRRRYRSLRYVPTAVGRAAAQRTLNLYRRRSCSSLLTADAEFAKQFARDHFFVLEGQVPIPVERMDDAAQRFGFTDAHFMKIGIQGAELEVFQSGPKLVGESLLAIRTDVEFAPLYKDQPLFSDIDADLRGKGFMFIGFPELHGWRRGTEAKPDHWNGGPTPMSNAQLIHGDALYFRRPEMLSAETTADQDRCINYALLAFAYGQLDLCALILGKPRVSQRVLEIAALDASVLVAELGRWHARRRRAQIGTIALRHWRDFLSLATR